jgi:hypothetical protein
MRSACLPPDEGGNQHAINDNQWQSVHAQRVLATFFEALPEGEV